MKTNNHNTDELEAKLLSRFGTDNPFTVPEGYFDNLSGRVKSRIAQRKRRRLIWRWAAAAVFVGCVAAGGLFFENRQKAQNVLDNYQMAQIAETEDIQYFEDEYIEEALDYSMIDNMSIASYLTESD